MSSNQRPSLLVIEVKFLSSIKEELTTSVQHCLLKLHIQRKSIYFEGHLTQYPEDSLVERLYQD